MLALSLLLAGGARRRLRAGLRGAQPGRGARGAFSGPACGRCPSSAPCWCCSLATLVGLMPSPDFPFDPRAEVPRARRDDRSVVAALLAYCAIAFFMRPLRPPPDQGAAETAAPAAVLLACAATLGVWVVNPVSGGAGGTRPAGLALRRDTAGRRAACRHAGLVLLGLLPLVALVAQPRGRFDAGLGVWHDLRADALRRPDRRLAWRCSAASWPARASRSSRSPAGPAGPQRPPSGDEAAPGRRDLVRRQPPAAGSPRRSRGGEPGARTPTEPAQPEPERDPRLWSKPRGWISPPPGSRRATPSPSST